MCNLHGKVTYIVRNIHKKGNKKNREYNHKPESIVEWFQKCPSVEFVFR